MFGHQVQLNFNEKSETHNTCIGGFFSIIIKILMTIYVGIKVADLVWHRADDNSSEISVFDV